MRLALSGNGDFRMTLWTGADYAALLLAMASAAVVIDGVFDEVHAGDESAVPPYVRARSSERDGEASDAGRS